MRCGSAYKAMSLVGVVTARIATGEDLGARAREIDADSKGLALLPVLVRRFDLRADRLGNGL
jgi:hypothetical protein